MICLDRVSALAFLLAHRSKTSPLTPLHTQTVVQQEWAV